MKSSMWLVTVLAATLMTGGVSAAVRINEICAGTTALDPNGQPSDWVELYNPDAGAVNLSGWTLRRAQKNSKGVLKNIDFTFPATNIAARGYLIVYCNEDYATLANNSGALCSSAFNIKAANTPTISLLNGAGTTLNQLVVPADLADETSYGYLTGAATNISFAAIAATSTRRVFKPVDGSLGQTWTATNFDDSGWTEGIGNVMAVPVGTAPDSFTSVLLDYWSDFTYAPATKFTRASSATATGHALTSCPRYQGPLTVGDITDDANVTHAAAVDFSANAGLTNCLSYYDYDLGSFNTNLLYGSSSGTVMFWMRLPFANAKAAGTVTYPDWSGNSTTTGAELPLFTMSTFASYSSTTLNGLASLTVTTNGYLRWRVTMTDYLAYSQPWYFSTDAMVADGKWHHIALTTDRSARTYKLYVDGALVKSGTDTNSGGYDWDLIASGAMCFGGDINACAFFKPFTGAMDGAAVARRELSADEITSVMNESAIVRKRLGARTMKYIRIDIPTVVSDTTAAIAELRLFTTNGTAYSWPAGTILTDSAGTNIMFTGSAFSNRLNGASFGGNEQLCALIDGSYGTSATVTTQYGYSGAPNRNKWFCKGKDSTTGTWWAQIELPAAIDSFSGCNICMADYNYRSPTAWTIQTSVDGTTWTTLCATSGASVAVFTWCGSGENDIAFAVPPVLESEEPDILNNDQNCVYARYPFVLPATYDQNSYGTLRFTVKSGLMLFLNGQELGAFQLTNGVDTIAWNTAAATNGTLADTDGTYLTVGTGESDVPFQAGTNILAAQICRAAGTTNSLSLDLALDYTCIGGASTNLTVGIMTAMTPGTTNEAANATATGAALSDTSFFPALPTQYDTITVNATVLPATADAPVTNVTMYYRTYFGAEIPLAMSNTAGNAWAATIPTSVLTNDGELVRWRFVMNDRLGAWKAPAFADPTAEPQYFGTMTESGVTSELPVFHLFVSASDLAVMDKQYDATAAAGNTLGARCSVYYDGVLYDNVRIDLRGQTTANFTKKSHGLKFNKGFALEYEPGKTIRRTSFIAEYTDPSFLRQSLAFWFMNQVGVKAPFHYPVRLQRNGQFYELAFHSARMSEDLPKLYGWNDTEGECELYKNVGTLTSSAVGCTSIIPEGPDGKGLTNANIKAFSNAIGFTNAARFTNACDRMDIPMWVNYTAATRISQECDDVWANLGVYFDLAGTGVWRPVAYDMNLSWGQWYCEANWGNYRIGERATTDRLKSHPLYGSKAARAYYADTTATINDANLAFDIIYANPSFRGMHLRRLRTLMDEWLKEPGTAKEATPLWQYFSAYTNRIHNTAVLDRAKWTDEQSSGAAIYCWPSRIADNYLGAESLWANYIVPRRTHLYVTHSITNAAYDATKIGTLFTNGVFVSYCAGIPESQPSNLTVTIAERVSAGALSYVRLDNPNAIYLDVSGWKLSGDVDYKLVAGTVIPPGGSLYILKDRIAFTAAHKGEMKFMTGNFSGTMTTRATSLTVTDKTGFVAGTAAYAGSPSPAQDALRIVELMYNPAGTNLEYLVLKNIGANALALGGVTFAAGISYTFPAGTTLAAGTTLKLAEGTYSGKLSNSGETVTILDAASNKVTSVAYDPGWYPSTDGQGASLLAVSPAVGQVTYDAKADWQPSYLGGWGGAASGNARPAAGAVAGGSVIINEVLSHSDVLYTDDFVELANIGTSTVSLAGWTLVNAAGKAYTNTTATLAAGGYLRLDQSTLGFGLYEAGLGESLTLASVYPGTSSPDGWSQTLDLGASPKDKSFSRFLTSDGKDYYPFAEPTPAATNAIDLVGTDVVISAIYTTPSLACDMPFIELENRSAERTFAFTSTQRRIDPATGANATAISNCTLSGAVEYTFPSGLSLAPGKKLLVVAFDPSDTALLDYFRWRYDIANATAVIGPFTEGTGNTYFFNYPGPVNDDGVARGLPKNVWIPLICGDEVHAKAMEDTLGNVADGEVLVRTNMFAFGSEPTAWQRLAVTDFHPGDDGRFLKAVDALASVPNGGTRIYQPTRSVNINFYSAGRGDSRNGGAVAALAGTGGAYAVPYSAFTDIVGKSGSSYTNIAVLSQDAASLTTNQSIVVTTKQIANLYTVGTSGNTLSEKLFYGYLDDSSSPIVIVTNIPFATWTAIAYAATDSGNVNFGYMTMNGANVSSDTKAASPAGHTVYGSTAAWGHSGPANTSNDRAEGVNYLVSQTQSNNTLTVQGHNSGGRGCIAAIQILEGEVQSERYFKRYLSGNGQYWRDSASWLLGGVAADWVDATDVFPSSAAIATGTTNTVDATARTLTLNSTVPLRYLFLGGYGALTIAGTGRLALSSGSIDASLQDLESRAASTISVTVATTNGLAVAGPKNGALYLTSLESSGLAIASGIVGGFPTGTVTVAAGAVFAVPAGGTSTPVRVTGGTTRLLGGAIAAGSDTFDGTTLEIPLGYAGELVARGSLTMPAFTGGGTFACATAAGATAAFSGSHTGFTGTLDLTGATAVNGNGTSLGAGTLVTGGGTTLFLDELSTSLAAFRLGTGTTRLIFQTPTAVGRDRLAEGIRLVATTSAPTFAADAKIEVYYRVSKVSAELLPVRCAIQARTDGLYIIPFPGMTFRVAAR